MRTPGQRVDEGSTVLAAGPALPEDEDADEPGNSEYVLRVRVSDPSTASDTVNLIVRVTEVNEPPAFDAGVPTRLRVRENPQATEDNPDGLPVFTLEDGARPVGAGAFAVTDQDGASRDPTDMTTPVTVTP